MPRLQGWKGTYSVYIPKAIVVALRWREGDEIAVEILPDKALKLRRVEDTRE